MNIRAKVPLPFSGCTARPQAIGRDPTGRPRSRATNRSGPRGWASAENHRKQSRVEEHLQRRTAGDAGSLPSSFPANRRRTRSRRPTAQSRAARISRMARIRRVGTPKARRIPISPIRLRTLPKANRPAQTAQAPITRGASTANSRSRWRAAAARLSCSRLIAPGPPRRRGCGPRPEPTPGC